MKHKNVLFKILQCIVVIGALLSVYLNLLPQQYHFLAYLVSFVICCTEIVFVTVRDFLQYNKNVSSLLILASCITFFCFGRYRDAVIAILIYGIFHMILRSIIYGKKKKVFEELDYASVIVHAKRELGFIDIEAREVVVGDEIEVRMGELLPVDATVLSGETKMLHRFAFDDSSANFVSSGDLVFSGSMNLGAPIRVLASADYNLSRSQKLFHKHTATIQRRASSEILFDRISAALTVCAVIMSLIFGVFVPMLSDGSYSYWICSALIILSVSSNRAFSLSVSHGYFGAISIFSKIGIVIKNKSYLDFFHKIRHVVFDKTGTLTEGEFSVKEFVPHDGVSKQQLLRYAALAESQSNHPVAKAILHAYGEIDFDAKIEHQLELPGEGICVAVQGERIYVGNYHLMDRAGVRYLPYYSDGIVIYVATETKYYGCIVLNDEVRKSSYKTVEALYKMGVSTITMLTGDKKNNAENTAARLGLQRYFAELLPEDKVKQMEHIMQKNRTGGCVAFVGDGVSDAPALSVADIGIAMIDDLPTDFSKLSDVVLLNHDPAGVACIMEISRKLRHAISLNIFFNFAVKALITVLAIFGVLPLSFAILLDGVCALIMTVVSWNVCKINQFKK